MKVIASGCLEGFTGSNVGGEKCVPFSREDAERAVRERQIQDQNRCPTGFKLVDIYEEPEEEYGNVGKCVDERR